MAWMSWRVVATTEGAVVFENELFQLLEYKPLTEKVHEKPLLIVPPCINKFYILDLQPDNSFVRYAVAQGNRTFVVSWRNADESLAQKTWDDYIEQAVITAIEQVRDITGAEQINALGFCVGGTLLTTALAVLTARHAKAKGRKSAFPVASVTLLTTLVDFGDTGVLDVFIDEPSVQFRELQMGKDFENTFGLKTPKGEIRMMSSLIDLSVFPGNQGGPLEHIIAAKAVSFGEALSDAFLLYAVQVQKNAKKLAQLLVEKNYNIVSGGTDNHLMLIDLRNKNISGKEAEAALVKADITANKNMVPFDDRSPFVTSGIRLGTAAITTRGLKEADMEVVAGYIDEVINHANDEKLLESIAKKVNEFMHGRPLFND